jgi:hypothetical protein
MLTRLAAIPVMWFTVVLQMTVVSRLSLISGSADLMILVVAAWSLQEDGVATWWWCIIGAGMIAYVSAIPWPVPILGYALLTWVTIQLKRRVWQTPVLAMLVCTFIGSVILYLLSIAALQITGVVVNWNQYITEVTLPSILLNLFLALPAYLVITDLANILVRKNRK